MLNSKVTDFVTSNENNKLHTTNTVIWKITYIISFCHFPFANTFENSGRNSVYSSYVEGNSNTDPHVCAIGRLAIPSSTVNWT